MPTTSTTEHARTRRAATTLALATAIGAPAIAIAAGFTPVFARIAVNHNEAAGRDR